MLIHVIFIKKRQYNFQKYKKSLKKGSKKILFQNTYLYFFYVTYKENVNKKLNEVPNF